MNLVAPARFFSAGLLTFALSSCTTGFATWSEGEEWAESAQAISGGLPAPADNAVVRIEYDQDQKRVRCSGVLLAPNLVATAAHCLTGQATAVDCNGPNALQLGALLQTSGFKVTATANLQEASPSHYHSVKSLRMFAEPGAPLCGNDVGVLQLSEPIPPSTTPLTPLLSAPDAGAKYSAFGYGSDNPSGTGDGVRRERASQMVICVGVDCEGTLIPGLGGASGLTSPAILAPVVTANEFLGSDGVCAGDSGGPAVLKRANLRRVLGVVSRGRTDCRAPVYSTFPDGLRAVARAAAQAGSYAPPAWSNEPTAPMVDPEPTGKTPDGTAGTAGFGGSDQEKPGTQNAPAGCQASPTPVRAASGWFCAALLFALLGGERRAASRKQALHKLNLEPPLERHRHDVPL